MRNIFFIATCLALVLVPAPSLAREKFSYTKEQERRLIMGELTEVEIEAEARARGCEYVESRLFSPGTAKFGDVSVTKYALNGVTYFLVKGDVDAANRLGQVKRESWAAVFEQARPGLTASDYRGVLEAINPEEERHFRRYGDDESVWTWRISGNEAFLVWSEIRAGTWLSTAEKAKRKKAEDDAKAESERLERDAEARKRARELEVAQKRARETAILKSAVSEIEGSSSAAPGSAIQSRVASGQPAPFREEKLQFVVRAESYLAANQISLDVFSGDSVTNDASVIAAAHKAVASKSQNSASVRFVDSSLSRAASKDGETLYCHVWGELESTSRAGEPVVANWSVILVGSQFVHPSTFELYRPSHANVDDNWKRHVMVWDVRPKKK